MKQVERIKAILLRPRETWPQIEAEAATPAGLYREYLMLLAAIPAVCGFIGMSLVGVSVFGVSTRVPWLAGLAGMVLSYGMSLIGIYVLSWIIHRLAPTFGGQANALNALKLAGYGATASLLGGVFSLLPSLSLLGVLAGLYSLYLIYLGLPVLMKNPPERSLAYTVVVVLCAIVLTLLAGALTSVLMPRSGLSPAPFANESGRVSESLSIDTPEGRITFDRAAIDAAAQGIRAAAAQQNRDQAAAPTAEAPAEDVATATVEMDGMAELAPFDAETLKAQLPESVGDFRRVSRESQDGTSLGLSMSQITAAYEREAQSVRVQIIDMGAAAAMMAMAASMGSVEREDEASVATTRRENGRTIVEEYQRDGSSASIKLTLKNGVIVRLDGQQIPIAELRDFGGRLALDRLEQAERPKADAG